MGGWLARFFGYIGYILGVGGWSGVGYICWLHYGFGTLHFRGGYTWVVGSRLIKLNYNKFSRTIVLLFKSLYLVMSTLISLLQDLSASARLRCLR